MSQVVGTKIASKTTKQNVLQRHPQISKHIPPTSMFSKRALASMINEHQMVYVKPNVGSGGFNVIRVEKLSDGYRFQIKHKVVTAKTFDDLFRKLRYHMKRKTYIIQKGIYMLKMNGSPVDYRVKYCKQGSSWRYLAIVGRVARSGLIVTNLHQGGTLVQGMTALRATVGSRARAKKLEMKRLTELSTKVLLSKYPNLTTLGFDYGIDRNGKIWMFEVNTNPN